MCRHETIVRTPETPTLSTRERGETEYEGVESLAVIVDLSTVLRLVGRDLPRGRRVFIWSPDKTKSCN